VHGFRYTQHRFYVSHTRLCVRRKQVCERADSPNLPCRCRRRRRARIYETAVFMYKYVLWELFFIAVFEVNHDRFMFTIYLELDWKQKVLFTGRTEKFLTVCSGFIICTRDSRTLPFICPFVRHTLLILDTCNLLPEISARKSGNLIYWCLNFFFVPFIPFFSLSDFSTFTFFRLIASTDFFQLKHSLKL
jgi:hypothetical protein